MERTATISAYGDENGGSSLPKEETPFHRRRQRKLSQSNPVQRRQGKLALFEGFGQSDDAPESSASATAFKAPRQPKNLGGNGFVPFKDQAPGHDRPYRFSFYSNALPVTIHARTLAELPADGQSFEDLFRGKQVDRSPQVESTDYGDGSEDDPEAATWWLDVLSPTDDEMRMLSKVFGIHPLTTEDILLEETREKIELFRNYYLVCFRSFDQDPYSQTYLEPLNMYIIVFREGTLSFHFRGTPHPQNVRRRIKHLKDYISVTSDWISYALIDDITDAFGPLIQSIEYEVDSIDELVLILKEAEQSDMLRRIGTCRKKVMGLLRLMGNKADVVKGLAKRCNEQWLVAPKSDIGLYLSDIQDHLITMTQNLNHYEKILSRSHSNYLAQISIEMTDANNQINDVLSKLTALGTVLIPMNLVTGLWGMNVHVPGQDITTGYAWFGGILGSLALFAVLGAFATVSHHAGPTHASLRFRSTSVSSDSPCFVACGIQYSLSTVSVPPSRALFFWYVSHPSPWWIDPITDGVLTFLCVA
ncbi:hypothetical protein BD324DRAFT_577597 [Kockovaella imperatae]|uniref:Cora-domain-containing protein n=1 Tax=Kockovaella imperatae TaxID=4999 RepID=A0A1Y1UJZ8_9TREE|nr:hypothetical protein BD324DRAFT_577597 [Kockovaella imperatae]ORX38390.1 hypothetical protein BD324DRAFT_577597 [Kockovaella imperatae]